MSRPAKLCRLVTGGFIVLYVAALALLAIGTFGVFGQPRDPLSGVFLIPLGLPWNRMIDVFPEPLWPWLAAAAPAVNAALLITLCRMLNGAARGHE
ncbi:hypothetical protein SAMN05444722_2147 [Rhodovulum sp. ES.010]|uniref:hypothetical protein n=1 Tax=Rhodovulum sp. ES.010 TaxID=1882821 RepID=UPI0009263A80|nr:hypothetical protein [Rhodovulum sp. ES.010]SIO43765.1 hypothetical protein SAMN05444722_2147 [Rhodovulum sp. ES.010]